MIQCNICTGN